MENINVTSSELGDYVELIKKYEPDDYERLIKYYNMFLKVNKYENMYTNVSLKDLENMVYTNGNAPMSDVDKINTILRQYLVLDKDGSGERLKQDIIKAINSIDDQDERIAVSRELLAKYGIEHDIDVYLFSECKKLFLENYSKVMSEGREYNK